MRGPALVLIAPLVIVAGAAGILLSGHHPVPATAAIKPQTSAARSVTAGRPEPGERSADVVSAVLTGARMRALHHLVGLLGLHPRRCVHHGARIECVTRDGAGCWQNATTIRCHNADGSMILTGTGTEFTVASAAQRMHVPLVIGSSPAKATTILHRAGLQVVRFSLQTRNLRNRPGAIVIEQSPEPGGVITRGHEVLLYLARGSLP